MTYSAVETIQCGCTLRSPVDMAILRHDLWSFANLQDGLSLRNDALSSANFL